MGFMRMQIWKYSFVICLLVLTGSEEVKGETKSELGQLVENALKEPTEDAIKRVVEMAFNARVAQAPKKVQETPELGFPGRVKRDTFSSVTCPGQTDQSAAYNLGNNPLGYPSDLISNELFVRSLPGTDGLFQCLAKEVIQPNQDPQLQPQPELQKGTTCPQVLNQLWTYNSVALGNQLCWFIASFQEDILYNSDCLGRECRGCNDPLSGSFFNCEKKLCFPRYRTVSLWAFCPSLPPNQRIVRDRIIIPSDCSCSTVTCETTHPFGYCFGWK